MLPVLLMKPESPKNFQSFPFFSFAAVVISQSFFIKENMVNHKKMVHPPCVRSNIHSL